MFPVGSFCEMESKLSDREAKRHTDIPITVGILVADYRQQFCKERIINYIDRLDKKSGKLIDFYIPGYCNEVSLDANYKEYYDFKEKRYYFSSQYFDEFIQELEKRNVIVTGGAQLWLIEYRESHFFFDNCLVFDLERVREEKYEDTVKLLFDLIFDISKRTVEYSMFHRSIMMSKYKKSVIEFVKVKAVDLAFDFLISGLSG